MSEDKNIYYVYVHRKLSDNSIFYVGNRYSLEDLKVKLLSLPTDFRPAKKAASAIEDFYQELSNMKLISDFRDYYDHWFESATSTNNDPLFERLMISGPCKEGQFGLIECCGLHMVDLKTLILVICQLFIQMRLYTLEKVKH